ERWSQLDLVVRFSRAKGDFSDVAKLTIGEEFPAAGFAMMEPEQADWDVVLKRVNGMMDRIVANAKERSLKTSQEKAEAVETEIRGWKAEYADKITWLAMKRQADETKEAYGERMAKVFMTIFIPSLGRAEEVHRAALLQDAMVDGLLQV